MRAAIIMAATASIPALAACGATDEAARDAFRRNSIQACLTSSRQSAPPALAGFDWERLCTCATDRIVQGKSASELVQLRPGGPGQREAVEQCFAEMQVGATPPQSGVSRNGSAGDKPAG